VPSAEGKPSLFVALLLKPGALSIGFLLFTLALCLLSLQAGCASVLAGGGDTGWLIASGQYILTNGHLPKLDIFTWTASDRPFICYQWLFEIFVALLFRAGGLSAVGAGATMAVAFLCLYALPRLWRQLGVPLALSFAFLLPTLTPFWFFARPQLVSYLAAFFCIQILERFRRSPRSRSIYFLPALVLLWTNMHCFAVLGPSLIAVYLLSMLLPAESSCSSSSSSSSSSCDSKSFRSLLVVFIASCLALFITPFDFATILLSLNIFVHTDPASCNELRPLYLTELAFDPANLYVLVAFLLLVCRHKKVPAAGLFISLAGLGGGLVVARLQPLGVILSWPFVGLALASYFRADPGSICAVAKVESKKLNLCWLASTLLCSLLIWFSRYPGEGQARLAYLGKPQTLQFVASHLGPSSHIFNDTISGSRLIFLSGPAVYIDSRLFLFDSAFYQDWLKVMNGRPGAPTDSKSWHDFALVHGIDGVVLRRGLALYQTLLDSADWLLVMDDGESSFWLKNNAQNLAQLKKWAVNCDRGESFGLSGSALAIDRVALAAKHLALARRSLDEAAFARAKSEAQASLNLVNSQAARALLQKLEQKGAPATIESCR
jgi:hypothetical protein